MTERYLVGEAARLRARFYAEDGTSPVAATGVRIAVLLPNGTTWMYQGDDVLTDGVGSFYVDHAVQYAGRHSWRGDCAGPTAAAVEGQFDGVRSRVLDQPEPDDPVSGETWAAVNEMVARAEAAASNAEMVGTDAEAFIQDAQAAIDAAALQAQSDIAAGTLVAQQAVTDATAAAVEAENAVSAGLGPVVLSSVAGTGVAYTASASHAVAAGRSYWFRPHLDNTGSATLTIDGGIVRSLRTETGTVLTAGMLRAGVEYLIRYDGTVYRTLGMRLIHRFQSRVNLVGTTATLDAYAADGEATARSRLNLNSSGSVLVQVGGDGTSVSPSTAITVASTKAVTLAAGLTVAGDLTVSGLINGTSGTADPTIYSASNPPPTTDAMIQVMEELGGVAAYESLIAARVVTTTHPFQVTPSDHGRAVRTNVSGSFIDVGDMLDGVTQLINVVTAGTVTIWTGEPGVVFTDRTSEQVRVSKGRYRVHRGSGNEWEIEAVNGKTITDASTTTFPLPTYNRRIATIGYSNAVRTMKNVAGWRDKFLTWGENPSVVNIISGVGASSFLKGGESDYPNNHWWDWEDGTPGPNVATFLAAIAAQPATPALEVVFVHLGYADMGLFDPALNPFGMTMTEAAMVEYWGDALTYIKGPSGLNLPGLKFVICPMSQRHQGAWDARFWYAVRRVMLEVCAQNPTLAIRGPESYDVRYVPSDSHPTLRSQAIFSQRWAEWSETALGRKAEFLGPKIVDVIQDTDTSTRVLIDPGPTEGLIFPGSLGDWNKLPPQPGVALVGPGSDFITASPLAVSNYKLQFTSGPPRRYTLTLTHASQAGVRLAYPYGALPEMGENPANCIRSNRTFAPLMTYHPTV